MLVPESTAKATVGAGGIPPIAQQLLVPSLTELVGCPASVTAARAQAWPFQQPGCSMIGVPPDWVTVTSLRRQAAETPHVTPMPPTARARRASQLRHVSPERRSHLADSLLDAVARGLVPNLGLVGVNDDAGCANSTVAFLKRLAGEVTQ